MPNALMMAGATAEPSNFVPLHTNRIFTGLWTNRSPMRDAATSDFQEHYGMGRQDSIWAGYNSEISARLTLIRRAGSSIYNANPIPPVTRFYSFNTFTLSSEIIRVMADTATTVYDVTAPDLKAIWTKSAGAGPTYFLGVGNTLYFTNGVDNKQVVYDPTTGTWGEVTDWGIVAPTTAPTVSQDARPNPYPAWQPNAVFGSTDIINGVIFQDPNGNLQRVTTYGTTGATEPNPWNPVQFEGTTDGSVEWQNMGPQPWDGNHSYAYGDVCGEAVSGIWQVFTCVKGGTSGPQPPTWMGGLGTLVGDGTEVTWQNSGALSFGWYGPSMKIVGAEPFATFGPGAIVDSNGYLQQIAQPGITGATPPTWQTEPGAYTTETSEGKFIPAVWLNVGPYSSGTTAPWLYGYAYMNSVTDDISNMSPPSAPISVNVGGQVVVQGQGSADPQVDTIPIYRTAQGGSTFLYLDEVPNPGAGQTWTYIDTSPDSELNTEIQAQVDGEGTPLPAGATCLGYHLERIFSAVGNVIYISSGPDAVVSTSSGNAGFDTTFTAQSRVTRFWACSLGMVVFTVRDAYLILGSATDADPLYMVVFIEDLPLKSYDCFTVNKTTPYLLMGNNQLVALDPSAGIIEAGFPIADRLIDEYDPTVSYVTFHSQSTLDTALYVANGAMSPSPVLGGPPVPAPGQWYRMAANNAPEQGSAWSTKATLANFNSGCVQSVEVFPGTYRLLTSGTTTGPILQRDRTKNTDNGAFFPVQTVFGSIVLAQPGQLAAMSFVTLESVRLGTRAGLALLLGEISGEFETLDRTRQDPPNLPPSSTLYSDRYHFAQNQKEAWCRHFQMEVTWPEEDAANELLTFTVFGQTWQEMRSQ